jgi:hypothetical protein
MTLISESIFERQDAWEKIFALDLPIPSWMPMTTIFSLDGGNSSDNFHDASKVRISLIPLSLKFWMQAFILLCLQSLFNIAVATLLYYSIVKPQEEDKRQTNRTRKNALSPLLIGYGILCPFLLVWPLYLFGNVLEFHNIALMLCLAGAVPNLLLLRVTEAIHGFLPKFCYHSGSDSDSPITQSSLSKETKRNPLLMMILYYSATLQFQFDPKSKQPIPLTRTLFWKKARKFVSVFIQTSLLYSLLLPYDYKVFSVPTTSVVDQQLTASKVTIFTNILSTVWYFYHPAKLANAYLMASLLSLVLDGT